MNFKISRAQSSRWLIALMLLFVLWVLFKGLAVDHSFHGSRPQTPFPEFKLSDIRQQDKIISQLDLAGKITIVHVWATWCSVCIQEHQAWLNIAKRWPYSIVGILYRDDTSQALKLIHEHHDPYTFLVNDVTGKLGLELGLRGTPETYIVDAVGEIKFHHLGPMSVALFESELLPILKQLNENII